MSIYTLILINVIAITNLIVTKYFNCVLSFCQTSLCPQELPWEKIAQVRFHSEENKTLLPFPGKEI